MKSEVVAKGIYQGYQYLVVKCQSDIMEWYCGYVHLSDQHPYAFFTHKQTWFDMGKTAAKVMGTSKPKSHRHYVHNGYENMRIDVHGGLTFCDYFKKKHPYFGLGAWIGWDYNHAGDYTWMDEEDVTPENKAAWLSIMKIEHKYPTIRTHRWTTEEVERDCRNVIDQLRKITIN